MRTIRRIIAALLAPIVLVVAIAVGTATAVLFTTPGHGLLARFVESWISGKVAGDVRIGGIGGSLFSHIVLDRVVVTDRRGVVIVNAPHLEASYNLEGLLRHRMVFSGVRADSLSLHLVRLKTSDRWNYEEVFHLGEGPPGTAPPPLVAFHDLRVTNAKLQIDAPTTPGPAHTAASRNARPAAQPIVDTTRAEGPVRIYVASELNARINVLRVSTPAHDPLLAQIADLRANLNDPQMQITQLAGQIIAAGDSLRFVFDSASFPSTRLTGGGAVRWPHGDLLFDFTFDAPRVALRDLWWIQPDLPDLHGRGHVVAKSVNEQHTDYRLSNLSLADDRSALDGVMTLAVDSRRGLGMRALDLNLKSLPIGVLRPYLDTLPVAGDLTGHLLADGYLDSLKLNGDLHYADALVAGAPTSRLRLDGVVHLGGDNGAVFQQFRLTQSRIPLATVHQLVPSVLITGDLGLDGVLNGPWKNAQFVGTVQHFAPDSSTSRLIGDVRLDTRGAVLGVTMDADLDALSFDALRSGYPSLPARGGVTGHVVTSGNLDSLTIDAHLDGEMGTIAAAGTIRVDAPHYGADSLVIDMQRVDVEVLRGSGSSTSLNGRIMVRGTVDSGVPPNGIMTLALDQSRVGGATVDAVSGTVRAQHGLVAIDSGSIDWNHGHIRADGALGWAAPDSGTLMVHAAAPSLAPFDSLVRSLTGLPRDTLHPLPLQGGATAELAIHGSLDHNVITGTVDGTQLALDDWHASHLSAQLLADSMGGKFLSVQVSADTAGIGTHIATTIAANLSGRKDSLSVTGDVAMVGLRAHGGGAWQQTASASTIVVDSLALLFPNQSWSLTAPTRLAISSSQLALGDTMRFRSADGAGIVELSGTTPGDTPGNFDASVTGLQLLDLFGVIDRDTTALDGYASMRFHLGGTRDAPVFKGTAAVISPVLGDLHAPSVQATFDYASQRLHADVGLWKTGQQVLTATASLPLDLALTARDQRKLGGVLQISGKADSVDMVILTALLPEIRNPTGKLALDVKANGTWQNPGLTGSLLVRDGGMSLPSLNVRYAPINGRATFAGDSLRIDSMSIVSSGGVLIVQGGVRFQRLEQPIMNLKLDARSFLAIDSPDFLTLRATGNLQLKGSIWQPELTGDRLSLSKSVIYFGDLLTKNVIDLELPENAALIDTAALHRMGLRNQFSNRFLDSLAIYGLPLHMLDDVWLRSTQANIQVQGDITVDKDHRIYSIAGNLTAPRGSYTLQFGPINRDFTVDQGTVRYFGTPDLNPDINISAHNQVRTADGDEFNVVANITGSFKAPVVTLTSPGRDISQRDLVSYVLLGRSELQAVGSAQNTDVVNTALTSALSALSGELQRSLVGGLGISTFTFRPGSAPGAVTAGSGLTQLAVGRQFGNRLFLTFDAGICLTQQAQYFQKQNFGASIEYRLSREFRFQASAEPVQSCITNRAADVFATLNRYQLGANLLWQRDY